MTRAFRRDTIPQTIWAVKSPAVHWCWCLKPASLNFGLLPSRLTFALQQHLLLLVGLPSVSGNTVVCSGYLLFSPLLKERLVPSCLMNSANLFFLVLAVACLWAADLPSQSCFSGKGLWCSLTFFEHKGFSQGRGKNSLFPLLQITLISQQIIFFLLLLAALYTNCNLQVFPSIFPTKKS